MDFLYNHVTCPIFETSAPARAGHYLVNVTMYIQHEFISPFSDEKMPWYGQPWSAPGYAEQPHPLRTQGVGGIQRLAGNRVCTWAAGNGLWYWTRKTGDVLGIFHQQNLFGCVCPGGICGDEDLGSALYSQTNPFCTSTTKNKWVGLTIGGFNPFLLALFGQMLIRHGIWGFNSNVWDDPI